MRLSFQLMMVAVACLEGLPVAAYDAPVPPFSPAVGNEGSTAIAFDNANFQGWATSVHSIQFGDDVAEEWKNPEQALGPAEINAFNVCVLGNGGRITLEFSGLINDGAGADFAVFENSFSDTFLELAFVEVSTDGIHFVRFPNYSLTAEPVPAFGQVQPVDVYGYAGKYSSGYGVPFDLQELSLVDEAIRNGYDRFSPAYEAEFVSNYPFLDLADVRYVRIIDIPGDGRDEDCEGYAIYDPYKTLITAGFDLDAVAVLNRGLVEEETFAEWSAVHTLDPDPEEDSDKDGWCQYLEYFLGTDPRDSHDFPEILTRVKPEGSFELTYWRRKLADVDPDLLTSADGSTWNLFNIQDASQIIETKVISGILFELETVTLPMTGDSLFVRFKL